MGRIRLLFLCTGNSCRSQMAEGWTRELKSTEIEAYSAGLHPKPLDPRAVHVMRESGIDISQQVSKEVGVFGELDFDYVVTVCGDAHETCPVVPHGTRVVHVGFDDPPRLAQSANSDEEALAHYRRVRDEILRFVESLPHSLNRAAA